MVAFSVRLVLLSRVVFILCGLISHPACSTTLDVDGPSPHPTSTVLPRQQHAPRMHPPLLT